MASAPRRSGEVASLNVHGTSSEGIKEPENVDLHTRIRALEREISTTLGPCMDDLRAQFPQVNDSTIRFVLESVDFDQHRAIETLRGMEASNSPDVLPPRPGSVMSLSSVSSSTGGSGSDTWSIVSDESDFQSVDVPTEDDELEYASEPEPSRPATPSSPAPLVPAVVPLDTEVSTTHVELVEESALVITEDIASDDLGAPAHVAPVAEQEALIPREDEEPADSDERFATAAETLKYLQSIFPSFEDNVILSVLEAADYETDLAVDMLLEMGPSSSTDDDEEPILDAAVVASDDSDFVNEATLGKEKEKAPAYSEAYSPEHESASSPDKGNHLETLARLEKVFPHFSKADLDSVLRSSDYDYMVAANTLILLGNQEYTNLFMTQEELDAEFESAQDDEHRHARLRWHSRFGWIDSDAPSPEEDPETASQITKSYTSKLPHPEARKRLKKPADWTPSSKAFTSLLTQIQPKMSASSALSQQASPVVQATASLMDEEEYEQQKFRHVDSPDVGIMLEPLPATEFEVSLGRHRMSPFPRIEDSPRLEAQLTPASYYSTLPGADKYSVTPSPEASPMSESAPLRPESPFFHHTSPPDRSILRLNLPSPPRRQPTHGEFMPPSPQASLFLDPPIQPDLFNFDHISSTYRAGLRSSPPSAPRRLPTPPEPEVERSDSRPEWSPFADSHRPQPGRRRSHFGGNDFWSQFAPAPRRSVTSFADWDADPSPPGRYSPPRRHVNAEVVGSSPSRRFSVRSTASRVQANAEAGPSTGRRWQPPSLPSWLQDELDEF